MGKRGPTPTPTKILKLRGSWRADGRGEEPEPSNEIARCPAWLSYAAKGIWKKTTELLDGMGILSSTDVNALARYCHMFARWKELEKFIAEHGEVYVVRDKKIGKVEGAIKSIRQYPQVVIAHKLALALLRLEQAFGLTPSARVGLTVTKAKEKENSKDRFFKNPLENTG